MKRWLATGLFFLATAVSAQAPSYLSPEAAVNKAGRQRMLAEFMVKEYLQAAEDVGSAQARGHLAEAVWVFDDQLGDLKAFERDAALQPRVADLDAAWQRLRGLITEPTAREHVPDVVAAGRAVHDAAEANVAALVEKVGTPEARLVSLAGRQRMLSQRIAKDLLLLAWRASTADAAPQLKQSITEFEAAHAELFGAARGEELRRELEAVDQAWKEIRPLLAAGLASRRLQREERMRAVAGTDAILNRMERATSLFQRQAEAP